MAHQEEVISNCCRVPVHNQANTYSVNVLWCREEELYLQTTPIGFVEQLQWRRIIEEYTLHNNLLIRESGFSKYCSNLAELFTLPSC
jgi:hypothetical protein